MEAMVSMNTDIQHRRKLVTVMGAAIAVVALAVSGCSSSKSSGGSASSSPAAGSSSASDTGPGANAGQTVNIVAYSVPKPAYDALSAA